MNGEALALLFSYTDRVLHMNLEGISHQDSLIQPEPGGNCINWVLGHIVSYRNQALKLLGEAPLRDDEELSAYARGSEPISDDARARPLEEMLADFDRSQERIAERLGRMSEEELAAPAKRGTVGQTLGFLHFHEAYHVGQIGLLRRLIGKEGVIK
jgi:uncharacterized damage-inducible protein DinB